MPGSRHHGQGVSNVADGAQRRVHNGIETPVGEEFDLRILGWAAPDRRPPDAEPCRVWSRSDARRVFTERGVLLMTVVVVILLVVVAAVVLLALFLLGRGIAATVAERRQQGPMTDEKRRQKAAVKRWGSKGGGGGSWMNGA